MTIRDDIKKKLRLERILRPKIRKLQRKMFQDFRTEMVKTGNMISVSNYAQELETTLDKHYESVIKTFSHNMGRQLPIGVRKTGVEFDKISNSLSIWRLQAAKKQTATILNTANSDMAKAVVMASEDELVTGRTGLNLRRDMAAVASAFFDNFLRRRAVTIALTETQIPVELVKLTEIQVLSGLEPSVTGGTPQEAEVEKEWITVGDSHVRPAHISADGQTVLVNAAFLVGGEALMYPGDSSLGASAKNVINCRCSVDYNKSDLVNLRRSV